MTTREPLRLGESALAAVPDPTFDTAALLCHATGLPKIELLLRARDALSPEAEAAFRALLARRAAREPLQYIVGAQGFYGLELAADPRALIPRPETETLCELALAFLAEKESPRVLDVCTGTGALALAIKREHPSADVTATDISADALALARENARRVGAEARFLPGDLLAPVAGERFDLIVSNPPYIESAACAALQPEVLYEPRLALDGGPDGLAFYRRLAAGCADHLSPGGALMLEIGDTQAASVSALLEARHCYQNITIHRDLCGRERVIGARMAAFPT